MSDTKGWKFNHDVSTAANWTPGLREIFEYRDLGIKGGTSGDYVAHLIRHNGKKTKDEVQQWHVHDCTFQMVYVLKGWIETELDGQGAIVMKEGSCWIQPPGIRHAVTGYSDDCEVLEIVLPADFKTVELE